MKPWICPKCGRVYSGMVIECRACNLKIEGRGGIRIPVTPTATQR